MNPSYRPDIDGLRAIAVLAIVLFHAGFGSFAGGFVGVDIFFVISGFLITTIIKRELDDGTFSIARFYERRVRRIVPALLVVMAVTLAAGALLLGAPQFDELGRSAVATSAFVSNFFFYSSTGYFDGPAELKPLLHTWSLAVEEQFYIFYPLLLMLIAARLGGRYLRWLGMIAIVSLLACVDMTLRDETAAFFLFPFRAWELLLGGLIALGRLPVPAASASRNALAGAGMACIIVAVFGFSAETAFPGYAAVLPVAGTAMVIHAGLGGPALVNRLLSWRPLVFTGLVSYSLYLWHWPVFVYLRYLVINEPTDLQRALALAAVAGLSILSWRFVETPFRDRVRFGPRERLFAMLGSAAAVVALSGVLVALQDGFPGRARQGEFDDILIADPGWQHWKNCEEQSEPEFSADLCPVGAGDVEASFLLWGDSHAMSLASAVNLSAARAGQRGFLAVRTGCPPLRRIERPGRRSCNDFNEAVLDYLAAQPQLGTVILSARWALSATGERYGNEPGDAVRLEDLDGGSGGNAALVERGLERTVAALEALGRRVVIVPTVPEIGFDVPSALFAARFSGRDVATELAPTVAEFRARTAASREILAELEEQGVELVDPADRLCGTGYCRIVASGYALYRDDNHLSLRGAIHIAGSFDRLFLADGPAKEPRPD